MDEPFYPFVEKADDGEKSQLKPGSTARVAVYDDPLTTPRVVEIEPSDVRTYLEQITETTSRLAREQGGSIPFMVIREVVENLIHAYFEQPIVSILNNGDTITFSDRGPGIPNKDLARQYGTSSATEEMRRYIRGVGSGLPYVEAWLDEHGGTLEIADNIAGGTMVTVSLVGSYKATDERQDGFVPPLGASHGTPETAAAGSAAQAAGMSATGMPQQNGPVPGAGYAPVGQQPYAYGYQQPVYQQQQMPYPAMPYGYPAYGQPMQAPAPYGAPMMWGQQPVQGAAVPQAMPASAAAEPSLTLDQREEQVMMYLASHESVGPKELMDAYAQSAATWSRVLTGLEGRGLLRKAGQKRVLTDAGRAWIQSVTP